jgi:hypothetical protein
MRRHKPARKRPYGLEAGSNDGCTYQPAKRLVFSRYSSTAMCERTEGFYELLASAKKIRRIG